MSAGPQPIPALAQNSGATHLAAHEWLGMPTDRFLRIIEKLERRQKPHGEWCFVALSLCLAFLIPLFTTEIFKALFGFKPEVWQAVCLLGAGASSVVTLALSVCWVYFKIKRPSQTAEQVLQEVVTQMEAERRRAAEGQRAAGHT